MVYLNSFKTHKTTTSSSSSNLRNSGQNDRHLNYFKEIQILTDGRPTSNKTAAHVHNSKALLIQLFHAVECTEHNKCIVPLCDQLQMFYLVDLGENRYFEAVKCLITHWNSCENENCEVCRDLRTIYLLDLPIPGLN